MTNMSTEDFFKIKVGGKYKTRGGEVVTVIADRGEDVGYRWVVDTKPEKDFVYTVTPAGHEHGGGVNGDDDLISEVLPTRTWYRIVAFKMPNSPDRLFVGETFLPSKEACARYEDTSLDDVLEWEEKEFPYEGGE